MSFLASWISNIIVFVLLATVIDMLLPNSNFQKYTKMVIGLILIAIIITPILHLFHTNFDDLIASATEEFEQGDEDKLGNLTELKKKEIQAAQSAYILEQMAVQLKADVEEELMENYQMEIEAIDVAVLNEEQPTLPDDLQQITLSLVEAHEENPTIETISKVEINTGKSPTSEFTDYEDIKQFLAEKWSVDEQMIQIGEERGD